MFVVTLQCQNETRLANGQIAESWNLNDKK